MNPSESFQTAAGTAPEESTQAAQELLKLAEAVEGRVESSPPELLAVPETVAASAPKQVRFRWWAPSMSDVFVVAFFLWTFVAGTGGWSGLLLDADSGWHIRTGDMILATHQVPHQDPFSFSKPQADWYAWEWLTDILWSKLHQLGGLQLVAWFSGVIIAAFVALLLRFTLWMRANLFITLFVALAASGAASIHFLARPHVFTLALVPLTVWLVESDRRQPTWRVYLIIPMVALWANLHGGFPAALLILGAAAGGSAIETLIKRPGASWDQAFRYGSIALASLGASLANPYGFRLHQHMAAYLGSDWIRNTIEEFRSPSFRGETMLQFEALMLIGILAAAGWLSRKRVFEALLIIGFAHMALASVRHVTMFAAAASPFIAVELTRWWNLTFGGASKKSFAGILNQMAADLTPSFNRSTLWLPAALAAVLLLPASVAHWPTDYPSIHFPVALIRKHEARLTEARLLTVDQWADYLIYRNYPKQRVFVDGRSDFFGPEIGNQYLALLQAQHNWKSLLRKWDFNLVLAPVDWPLASLLKADPEWRVVEDTGKAILIERISQRDTQIGTKVLQVLDEMPTESNENHRTADGT